MAVLFRISLKGSGYADGTLCCSHLETMDFWVDLIKTETDEWYWGDGVALNLTQVSSHQEKFLCKFKCHWQINILVSLRVSECQNSVLVGMKFNDTAVTHLTASTGQWLMKMITMKIT